MPKKRASGEEIIHYFEHLESSTGTAEERVSATALHFGIKPPEVHHHLKFWWPGRKYLEVFGSRKTRIKWDRPTDEILKALNAQGSVTKAAKSLGTTSITLTKALARHGIVQRWVQEVSEGEASSTRPPRSRRRRRPQAKFLWPDGPSSDELTELSKD